MLLRVSLRLALGVYGVTSLVCVAFTLMLPIETTGRPMVVSFEPFSRPVSLLWLISEPLTDCWGSMVLTNWKMTTKRCNFFASLKSNANDGGYFSTENNKARDILIELSFSHKNMSQLKLIENIKSVIWNTRHLKLIVFTLFRNQPLDRKVLLASLSLTLYNPASVCIFSILVSRYFQRYWQGEFV